MHTYLDSSSLYRYYEPVRLLKTAVYGNGKLLGCLSSYRAPSFQEITLERGGVRGTNAIEKSTRTIMRLL